MTNEEFKSQFGMEPERAKEILKGLRYIVNQEVDEVIAHANFYIDPEAYGYDGELTKDDEDDDGYTCLYDYGNQCGGAVKAFMDLISFHTAYGGQTSAIEACKLMGIKWDGDK